MSEPTLITSLDEIVGPGLYAHPDRPDDWVEINRDNGGYMIGLAGLIFKWVGRGNKVRHFKTIPSTVRFLQRRLVQKLKEGQRSEAISLGAFITQVHLDEVRRDRLKTRPLINHAVHDNRRSAVIALAAHLDQHEGVTIQRVGAAEIELLFNGVPFVVNALA